MLTLNKKVEFLRKIIFYLIFIKNALVSDKYFKTAKWFWK